MTRQSTSYQTTNEEALRLAIFMLANGWHLLTSASQALDLRRRNCPCSMTLRLRTGDGATLATAVALGDCAATLCDSIITARQQAQAEVEL